MHHIYRFLILAAVNVKVNAFSTQVPAVAMPFASPSLSSTTLSSTPTRRTTSILNVNAEEQQQKIEELLSFLDISVRVLDLGDVNMNSPKLVLDACFALCSAMEHTSMIQDNNSYCGAST